MTTTKTIIYNEEEDGVMMVVEVAYRPSRHINSHQCTIVFISRTDFRSRGRARGRGLSSSSFFFNVKKRAKQFGGGAIGGDLVIVEQKSLGLHFSKHV